MKSVGSACCCAKTIASKEFAALGCMPSLIVQATATPLDLWRMLQGFTIPRRSARRRESFSPRLFGTLIVVLSLLFSQLALANYVCFRSKTAGNGRKGRDDGFGRAMRNMDPEEPAL